MHALMTAILLGMAWFYALDGNAEAQPPQPAATLIPSRD
jgi:hypothetical protein